MKRIYLVAIMYNIDILQAPPKLTETFMQIPAEKLVVAQGSTPQEV